MFWPRGSSGGRHGVPPRPRTQLAGCRGPQVGGVGGRRRVSRNPRNFDGAVVSSERATHRRDRVDNYGHWQTCGRSD